MNARSFENDKALLKRDFCECPARKTQTSPRKNPASEWMISGTEKGRRWCQDFLQFSTEETSRWAENPSPVVAFFLREPPLYPAKRVPLFTPCGILEDTWSIQKEDIKPYLAPQMCHQLHLPVKGWTRAVFWTNGACQNPPGEFFLTNKDSRSHSSDSEPDSPGQALL